MIAFVNTRHVHKVSFPLVPQLINNYCVNRLHVRERVMSSHDSCTSGTSRVMTVASLQRLKLEAFIPASAYCEVRSVIKLFNAQSIALIEIHDTGLVFGEFRFQITVLTKRIWVLSVVSLSH